MKKVVFLTLIILTSSCCAQSFNNNTEVLLPYICSNKDCIEALNDPFFNKNLRKFYNISGIIKFVPVYQGVANFIFLVKNNGKIVCVLKCLPQKNIQEITKISDLTEKFRKEGFPVPKVDFLFSIPSHPNTLVAMQYCTGNNHGNLQKKERERIAKSMANLHLFNVPHGIPVKHITNKKFEKLFNQCKGWKHIAEMREIYKKIDLNYLTKLPLGLNHGDFSTTNILFDNNNEIVGILDFDRVSKSYLLTDLARAQIFFGFDEKGNLQEKNILQFLKAYNFYRPLTKEELANFYQHLKLMLIYVALAMYYYMYIKKDLDPNRFTQSKLNTEVSPEMLFHKLLQIKDMSFIDIN